MVDYNNFNEPYYLPIGDLRYIEDLLRGFKEIKDASSLDSLVSLDSLLEPFFSRALVPFYDAMWDGLDTTAGHVIYRLSDLVPEEKRRNIAIYPASTGSLIIEQWNWATLEDWRKEWERYHKDIPQHNLDRLIKMLPLPHLLLQKNDQK